MNYNDFTYHRANPYANQGYMPPIAHTNRHKAQFLTEMPMGQQHLQKIGRRQYAHALQQSNIQAQSILKSPQRYPFQNRIALQKNYQRNLNTIDIEGATSGTLKSEAVRNKLRARQQLIRQQKQTSTSHFAHLQHLQSTQQQKRRQIAQQQFIRNQQIKQLNAGKIVKAQDYQQIYQARNNMINNQQYGQYGKSYHRKETSNSQYKSNTPQKSNNYNIQTKINTPRYQSIDFPRSSHNPQSDSINQLIKPRQYGNIPNLGNYQSYQQQPQQISNYNTNNNPNNNNNNIINPQQKQLNKSTVLKTPSPYIDNNNKNININSKSNQLQSGLSNSVILDKKYHRQLNPTVLSAQNSMYLAGRNIIEN